MTQVYIVGGLRTPIVTSRGKFQHIRPEILGAKLIQSLVTRYELAESLSGVIAGNAVGTGGNISRLMSLEAGLKDSIPALTVDMQCASGLEAINIAYAKLISGQGASYIAGGMESASLQPLRTYAAQDPRYAHYEGGTYMTAQFSPAILSEIAMLEGAEGVIKADNITELELNRWAVISHERAKRARAEGLFKDIIQPIEDVVADDGISNRMSEKLLKRLPKVLGEGTHITAGNACRINDGAAMLVLMNETALNKVSKDYFTHNSLYRIVGAISVGTKPTESPRGAMLAADKLLAALGMGYEDMDAIEFNEAFAVIDVLFERKYKEQIDSYNIFGGALAYGHPYGASGGIIMLHLMKALDYKNGRYGIASIAGAGGMGTAIVVERVNYRG